MLIPYFDRKKLFNQPVWLSLSFAPWPLKAHLCDEVEHLTEQSFVVVYRIISALLPESCQWGAVRIQLKWHDSIHCNITRLLTTSSAIIANSYFFPLEAVQPPIHFLILSNPNFRVRDSNATRIYLGIIAISPSLMLYEWNWFQVFCVAYF